MMPPSSESELSVDVADDDDTAAAAAAVFSCVTLFFMTTEVIEAFLKLSSPGLWLLAWP